MRKKLRRLGPLVLVGALLGSGSTPAVSQMDPGGFKPLPGVELPDPSDPCVEACIEQTQRDLQDCSERLSDRLAELGEEAEACYELPSFEQTLRCLHQVEMKRHVAERDFKQCVNMALTNGYNCARECQMSPSAP